VMDERHLLAAAHYVELNPVRAGLARTASAWRWSSARAHLAGVKDELVTVAPMLDRVGNWLDYLQEQDTSEKLQAIRSHTTIGRPLGSDVFLGMVEARVGRELRKRRPGPQRKFEHN
jgi:putative transposase